MRNEYKTALGWKIFVLIGGLPLCGLFIWSAYTLLIDLTANLVLSIIMLPIIIGMILVFVYGIVDMFVSKLIISDNEIKTVNIWGAKKLTFEEIKGIRSDEGYVRVIPIDDKLKPIKISQYYGKKSDWQWFLNSRFENLDVEEYLKNKEKLTKDKTYGSTQWERDQNIRKTKQLTLTLNSLSWAAAAWYLFIPRPYELVTAINIILPFIGMFFLYLNSNKIRILNTENSPYPSLSSTLSIPPMIIMIRALTDFDILEYQNAWIYTAISTPIILLILARGSKSDFDTEESKSGKILTYSFSAIIIGLFIFFGSLMVNCAFDESKPVKFESTVLKRRVSSGKTTRYLLTISPWESIDREMEVGVTKSQYDSIEENEKVTVYQQKGLINIPWFYVGKK